METHFEGSRGSEQASTPHQRQYDEKNPDLVNQGEDKLDSDVNTDFDENARPEESLTDDESASTDPNDVPDKPSFKNDNH